jgi:hypothetical protein
MWNKRKHKFLVVWEGYNPERKHKKTQLVKLFLPLEKQMTIVKKGISP